MKQLYFSSKGYELQKAKIASLELEIKNIQSNTHDVSESEGNILEDNPGYESIQQATSVLATQRKRLKDELDNAQIIKYPKSVDEVCIGCAVDIEIDGNRGKYDIVGFGEIDGRKNVIIYTAPIAQALMGKKPGYGDNVKVNNAYKVVRLFGVSPIVEK